MTREEIIDGLEIYTVGRSNKSMVHITVEELQNFIDGIKEQEPVIDKVRAEIEAIIGEHNLDDYDFCSGLICARKIIDKYRKGAKYEANL